jgi:tRNA (guanosine-2'-O-)-methyltransferase
MKPLDPTGLKRLHREWRRDVKGRLGLVLDSVQGPFNVGAILRTAAAYRVDRVWLAGATPSARSPGVQKTALGTDRYLTITAVERAVDAVEAARSEGFRIVGIELAEGAHPIHDLKLGEAACLVVGNEDHGISAAVLRACDDVAFLPQLGKVGSLNVATAASIALYEARRQEWTSGVDEP